VAAAKAAYIELSDDDDDDDDDDGDDLWLSFTTLSSARLFSYDTDFLFLVRDYTRPRCIRIHVSIEVSPQVHVMLWP
jgi:hypothetical protein